MFTLRHDDTEVEIATFDEPVPGVGAPICVTGGRPDDEGRYRVGRVERDCRIGAFGTNRAHVDVYAKRLESVSNSSE